MSTTPEVLPAVPAWKVEKFESGATLHQAWLRPQICRRSVLGLSVLVSSSGTVVASVEGPDCRFDEIHLPYGTAEAGMRWAVDAAAKLLNETHRLLQQLGGGR